MSRRLFSVPALAALAGCSEVAAPPPQPPPGEIVTTELVCTADALRGELRCGSPSPTGANRSVLIVGGQHQLVRLSSDSTVYTEGDDVLSSLVRVQNLLQVPMATADGTTPSTMGVRVFFSTEPSNGVTVENPTGRGTFTAADQAYFEYDDDPDDEVPGVELGGDGRLISGEVSAAKRWRFSMNGATSFSFVVYVQTEVPPGSRYLVFEQIDAGTGHTCAIQQTTNYAYCWGSNGHGELGTSGAYRIVPRRVTHPSGVRFSEVRAGTDFTCALDRSTARPYCWGANGLGQVGDSTTVTPRTTPTAVKVPAGLTFTSLGVGFYHACALTAAGQAHCWGYNSQGQLGDSTTTQRAYAAPVLQRNGLAFESLSVGDFHTCGLTASGQAYCWGQNTNHKLGIGSAELRHTYPSPVVQGELRFTSITAGLDNTCALSGDGEAYCWGDNDNGQIGDGTNTPRETPWPVTMPPGETFAWLTVTTGGDHACAVTPAGKAYCWGSGGNGRLGYGGVLNRPTPTAVAQPRPFARIELGRTHACALVTNGPEYCWGTAFEGRLGNGLTEPHSLTPGPVAGTI